MQKILLPLSIRTEIENEGKIQDPIDAPQFQYTYSHPQDYDTSQIHCTGKLTPATDNYKIKTLRPRTIFPM